MQVMSTIVEAGETFPARRFERSSELISTNGLRIGTGGRTPVWSESIAQGERRSSRIAGLSGHHLERRNRPMNLYFLTGELAESRAIFWHNIGSAAGRAPGTGFSGGAGVVEAVDTEDLKFSGVKTPCGFESRPRHQ